jgi:hypothetical protein
LMTPEGQLYFIKHVCEYVVGGILFVF